MPASNAFTGFTSNGQNLSAGGNFNVDGTTDYQKFFDAYGHNFWTNSSKNKTIFFPASGLRNYTDGSLSNVGVGGCYWSAVPHNSGNSYSLYFERSQVLFLENIRRPMGYAVRPVSE